MRKHIMERRGLDIDDPAVRQRLRDETPGRAGRSTAASADVS